MFNLLKSMLILSMWKDIDIREELCKEDNNMSERCATCKMFSCEHIRGLNKNIINMGEPITDLMESFSGTKPVSITEIENTTEQTSSSSKMIRVLVPPPPVKIVNKNSEATSNQANSTDLSPAKEGEWVTCHLCQGKVYAKYVERHLRVHLTDYSTFLENKTYSRVNPDYKSTYSNQSTSIVHVPNNTKQKRKESPIRLHRIVPFKFNKVDSCTIISSTNKTGRFSETALVFWYPAQASIKDATYAGGKSFNGSEFDRLSISISYDNKDDFFILTSKFLTRAQYSQYDKESSIPDRICFQEQLFSEIKRICLHYRISPRDAYVAFMSSIRSSLSISTDDDNTVVVKSKNYNMLYDLLTSNQSTHSSNHRKYDADDWVEENYTTCMGHYS